MKLRPNWAYVSLTALLLGAVVIVAMTTTIDMRISDAIFAAGGNS